MKADAASIPIWKLYLQHNHHVDDHPPPSSIYLSDIDRDTHDIRDLWWDNFNLDHEMRVDFLFDLKMMRRMIGKILLMSRLLLLLLMIINMMLKGIFLVLLKIQDSIWWSCPGALLEFISSTLFSFSAETRDEQSVGEQNSWEMNRYVILPPPALISLFLSFDFRNTRREDDHLVHHD